VLRFATAGSVDDGKSTLIGRLLYDSKSLMADQVEHVEDVSRRRGHDGVDLSLLTDGLRAEREQGITIDVAYRYFATPARRFIIADTPGHAQYTRNMVTGASTADLALILVDVRHGCTDQTRRHVAISKLLGVPEFVVCVNKMDLVGYSEERFDAVCREVMDLGLGDATYIPISALHGDNVVDASTQMDWYGGEPLLRHLETVEPVRDLPDRPLRFPVQYVIRTPEFRGYAGTLASGRIAPGDEVVVLPRGQRTRVAWVDTEDAAAPLSIVVRLEDDIDVARGDLLAAVDAAPQVVREVEATVCWMGDAPARVRSTYLLKHTTRTVRARLESADGELSLNDIATTRLRLAEPIVVDPYAVNRATGAFILIDEASNETVAAGMIA
jgi:sulfate adenylyltransferase large subunit